MLNSILTEAQDALHAFRYGWSDYGLRAPEAERITFVGMPSAGKRTLYNHLIGWTAITPDKQADDPSLIDAPPVHDYGLFSIINLSADPYSADSVIYQLEDSAAVVYVLDGAVGLRSEDYQWIARLRTRRAALLIVLNKADCVEQVEQVCKTLEAQLALPVLPIAATNTAEVQTVFAQALIKVCPQVMVPLAEQVKGLRRTAAQRLIWQTALLSLITSLEPLPLVDLSVLIGLQICMVNQLGKLYGIRTGGQTRWEIAVTVALGLLVRYAAQTLAKLVPYGGWIASGVIGASGTWLVGQAAVAYLEAEAAHQPFPRHLAGQVRHALQRRVG